MRQRFAVEEITERCLAEDNSRHKGDDDRRYIDREVHCQRVKSDVGSVGLHELHAMLFFENTGVILVSEVSGLLGGDPALADADI